MPAAFITMIPLSLALALGRIGNFINGELAGIQTNVPWCVQFKGYEGCRHPSQIYSSLQNLFIFFALLTIRNKKFKKGTSFRL
jgi:phosphatidylglycerol:prolipoprotein diacylglycerol transferase